MYTFNLKFESKLFIFFLLILNITFVLGSSCVKRNGLEIKNNVPNYADQCHFVEDGLQCQWSINGGYLIFTTVSRQRCQHYQLNKNDVYMSCSTPPQRIYHKKGSNISTTSFFKIGTPNDSYFECIVYHVKDKSIRNSSKNSVSVCSGVIQNGEKAINHDSFYEDWVKKSNSLKPIDMVMYTCYCKNEKDWNKQCKYVIDDVSAYFKHYAVPLFK
ncbi:hypothetical protein BCR32DRAFT_328333 [Anaeromyces robustus]|uniref:Uncharacterized protein n=1 Tax=Anaeromyces robustus TaxID=1754192 RepID=A0A1Y1WZV9_9FUNG|nr:hypothetical protein BCR32DRAFT_328333 [Anaeromyces robustus]|eukprot:ORX78972.1 hypothetical protein BCR32DRAFT_328333 [Anaeromyces robustus]